MMARRPNPKSSKTTVALPLDVKRQLVALTRATGDDMNRVISDALNHYADLLLQANPVLLQVFKDLKRPLVSNRRR